MKVGIPEAPQVSKRRLPLVFIIFNIADSIFQQKLRSLLSDETKFDLISVSDWPDIHGKELRPLFQATVERADVAVLLLSPKSISQFSLVEGLELVKQRKRGGLRLLPIVLSPCNWREVTWLSETQVFPLDGKPISAHSEEEQDILLAQAAKRIIEVATNPVPIEVGIHGSNEDTAEQGATGTISVASAGDSFHQPSEQSIAKYLEKYQLSNEANKIVHRAQVLATFKEDKRFVTTSCLLFAIAEGGRSSSNFFRTPQFLWEELRESRIRKIYETTFKLEFPHVQYSTANRIDFGARKELAQAFSRNALAVLNTAHRFSVKTTRPETQAKSKKASESSGVTQNPLGVISSRHLFAALLLFQSHDATTGAVTKVLSLGVDLMRLRKNFLDFVVKSLPDDDHNAWREILLTGGTRQPGELSIGADDDASLKQAPTQQTQSGTRVPLPGFLTDSWQGEDLLNITRDVNALASLIAAWTVRPPLSIGLFGHWGSGKTHFMRQLKSRVEKLSCEARNSGLRQNAVGYYKNIVQIEFNAWHYIEGNLWASLVEHIFTNLKFSDQEDSNLADTRRQALMEKLDLKRQVQAKVEERKAQLKIKETRARHRAVEAKSSRDDTAKELSRLRDELAVNVLNQLTVSIKFTPAQQALLEQLGVPKNSLTSAAGVKRQYLEVQGLYQSLRANWNLWKTDPEQWRKWMIALALVAIPALVADSFKFFREMWAAYGEMFANIGGLLTSSITVLFTWLVAIKPYWKQFRKGVAALREKADSIEQERQKRILELKSELDVMTQQYKEAEREADTINREVRELEAEIAGTTAGKILAEFIEDRAAADDYRRHLGVPALIRRDFEQLSTLFEEQRAEELVGNGATDDNTINRIILYIDDLDRCPPERVVQVLQAIHLLLAFPLFVVVVCVDPRWMIRSLQESYDWLRAVEHGEDKRLHSPHEFSAGQIATPHDYLEKIFQIPFWLKPMEDVTCRMLLEGLTRDSRIKVVEKDGKDKQRGAGEVKTDNVQQGETSAFSDGPSASAPQKIASAQEQTVEVKMHEDKDSEQGTAPRSGESTSQPASREITTEQQPIHNEEAIDLAPESLTLSDSEIEYMKELTRLIGRSPRAVKRFLNCYRLIRAGLRPKEIGEFIGKDGSSGEFKAVMILLGLITGNPSISLFFLTELEKPLKTDESNTIETFLNRMDRIREISLHPDWHGVKEFLENHIKSEDTFASMLRVAPRVSRYSFRVASKETAGMRKDDLLPRP